MDHLRSYGAILLDLVQTPLPNTLLARSIESNWEVVSSAISPLMGVFIGLGAIFAALALIAFAPGEALEKIIRRWLFGLGAATLGALVGLTFVALGFGGTTERRVYVGQLNASTIIDADTLRWGDVSIRLSGIDGLEKDQTCWNGSAIDACGERAQSVLAQLVESRRSGVVICRSPLPGDETGAWRKDAQELDYALDRLVARCWLRISGSPSVDLAEFMVLEGLAVAEEDYRSGGPSYAAAELHARELNKGVWSMCTYRPRAWRNPTAQERGKQQQALANASPQRRIGSMCMLSDTNSNAPQSQPSR
ncbi:MAG: thermonuclease family protein [Caulobacterales bacterium]